jgi:hypothetical protein
MSCSAGQAGHLASPLFIYMKALPNMVGQPQQLEANYSGPNNITYISL